MVLSPKKIMNLRVLMLESGITLLNTDSQNLQSKGVDVSGIVSKFCLNFKPSMRTNSLQFLRKPTFWGTGEYKITLIQSNF